MALALVLALVALGMVVVEVVPRLTSGPADEQSEADELLLRFGDPATAAAAQPPHADSSSDVTEAAQIEGVEGVDYHIVRDGDTLSSIAERYLGDSTRADELARFNGLANADQIEIGQVVWVR